jgi:choline dehydrogenase-like flavoprotein
VADHRSRTALTESILAAAEQVGLPFNSDYNGDHQEGVAFFQVNQRAGRRWSAADAWLRPALRRKNLTVRTRSTALRVVTEAGRATGVVVAGEQGTTTIRARREVILSAGAIGSPQLLMLSGIGPADHLREHDIPVLVDNPHVGEHYQDHPFFLVNWETTAKGTLAEAEKPWQLVQYFVRGRGLLTSTVAEGTAFLPSHDDLPAPDLQLHFGAAYFHNHGLDSHDRPAFCMAPTLVAPQSRGRLRLRSADPAEYPSIVGNHLTEPADVEAMRVGVELVREIAAQPALSQFTGRELTPGPSVTGPARVEAALRRDTELIYHPTSTARMGTEETGVVDPDLRVHGLAGLRVVDASVFPTITRGNTNAPVYMVAERAADLIRASG